MFCLVLHFFCALEPFHVAMRSNAALTSIVSLWQADLNKCLCDCCTDMPALDFQNCKMKLNLYGKHDLKDHQEKKEVSLLSQLFYTKQFELSWLLYPKIVLKSKTLCLLKLANSQN